MNSLEFINLEIAITKTRLKEHYKFAQTQLAIKDEKRLQTLQQIKTILEAWEVVKKVIRDSSGMYLLRLDSEDEDDKEYYETLKKALEIENDRNIN